MTEWKPDNEFLDYLLKQGEGNNLDEILFVGDSEELSPRTMVEKMREGKDEDSRKLYNIAYDMFKQDFEAYKANKQ